MGEILNQQITITEGRSDRLETVEKLGKIAIKEEMIVVLLNKISEDELVDICKESIKKSKSFENEFDRTQYYQRFVRSVNTSTDNQELVKNIDKFVTLVFR